MRASCSRSAATWARQVGRPAPCAAALDAFSARSSASAVIARSLSWRSLVSGLVDVLLRQETCVLGVGELGFELLAAVAQRAGGRLDLLLPGGEPGDAGLELGAHLLQRGDVAAQAFELLELGVDLGASALTVVLRSASLPVAASARAFSWSALAASSATRVVSVSRSIFIVASCALSCDGIGAQLGVGVLRARQQAGSAR